MTDMRKLISIVESRTVITAWHGSPHHIEQFSTKHVGTGEGHQAYGWGLYFASHPDVGSYYHDALTTGCKYRGSIVDLKNDARQPALYAVQLVALELVKGSNKPNIAIENEVDHAEKTIEWMTAEKDHRLVFWQGVLAALRRLQPADFESYRDRAAYMYKVAIPTGPYLDWDKPFRLQDRSVKIILNRLRSRYTSYLPAAIKDNNTGEVIYRCLENFNRNVRRIPFSEVGRTSSLDLSSAGIKGIRYLDAGSREGDGQTYNYVVFDDDDVTIQSVEHTEA